MNIGSMRTPICVWQLSKWLSATAPSRRLTINILCIHYASCVSISIWLVPNTNCIMWNNFPNNNNIIFEIWNSVFLDGRRQSIIMLECERTNTTQHNAHFERNPFAARKANKTIRTAAHLSYSLRYFQFQYVHTFFFFFIGCRQHIDKQTLFERVFDINVS